LEEAHRKGIIHRDIKPQNIMITSAGIVKIMDFGVAKLRGTPTLTESGSRVGTLDYAAPEVVMGSKSDHRSDIFSLGVVLYELLTGQRPFQGDHDAAVVYAIANEIPRSLIDFQKDIPADLDQIVMKMLEKKKERRYQSLIDLLTDLKRINRDKEDDRRKTERIKHEGKIKSDQTDPHLSDEEGSKYRRDSVTHAVRKKFFLYTALIILLTMFTWIGIQGITGGDQSIDSIAVLPLENLSGDAEQDYFVNGMTDALITNLTRIGALKVISKTSVMQYRGTNKTLPDIAQELNVDAIIEGSVLHAGNDVRITVQLIEGKTDNHLWAESYERKLENILRLQSEVARAIAKQIKLNLTPTEQERLSISRSVDPEAYRDYLKGTYFFDKHSESGFRKSIKYFEAVIEKDPTFANAYAGLTMAYIGFGSPGLEVLHPREIMLKAKAAAVKALELDDLSSEAHTMLGLVNLFYDWDWVGAEKELKRGIELNPNYALGYMFYSLYLTIVGEHKEAIRMTKIALELDPFSVSMNVTLGNQYFEARKFDQAIEQLITALEMNPDNWHAHWSLGMAYTQKQMYEKAISEQEKAIILSARNPFVLSSLGHTYALAGKRSEAMMILDELIQISKQRYVAPFAVAQIYIGLGNKDQAFEWLEKGYQDRSASMIWLGPNSIFDPLRSDIRFKNLLKKMGLDNYHG
jgi:TolB-like protein/Tfp pilus assembly protein PilF